jgi:hypothetical protein
VYFPPPGMTQNHGDAEFVAALAAELDGMSEADRQRAQRILDLLLTSFARLEQRVRELEEKQDPK